MYELIFRKCLYVGDCKGKFRKYSYTNKRDRVELSKGEKISMNRMFSQSSGSDYVETIDITGLCNASDVTETLNQYPYWMQMYIPETLCIPEQKPDAESINAVNVSVNILRNEVINTPSSSPLANLEGKIVTGRKLIVEGQFCQLVEYTANDLEQSVHSAHFYVPFSAYIVVPETITFTLANDTTVTLDSLNVDFQVNACVEDLSVQLLDERTILKRVTLLVYAVPTQ